MNVLCGVSCLWASACVRRVCDYVCVGEGLYLSIIESVFVFVSF